jgi:hypothetical protein
MKRQRSYHITREEKYALSVALTVFALSIISIYLLRVGSYLEVRQQEITVIVSPTTHSPLFFPSPQSSSATPQGARGEGTHRKKNAVIRVPVPVPGTTTDTSGFQGVAGNGSLDSASTALLSDGSILQSIIDTFLVLYPGYRQSVLREEMKKTCPRTTKDSLLAWAKDNFMAQVIGNGKIDKATIDLLLMRRRSESYGPYHIAIPSIGPGVGFDYTEILKEIISIFEKAPKD